MLPWYRTYYESEAERAITWTPLAHALHNRLRNAAWRAGALPRARLAPIAHVTQGEFTRAWPEIAALWIDVPERPGFVTCPEVDELREHSEHQSAKQSDRAFARWRKSTESHDRDDAAAVVTASPAAPIPALPEDEPGQSLIGDLRSQREDQRTPCSPPQAEGRSQGSLFAVASEPDLGTAAAGPKVAAKRVRKPKAAAEPDPNAPPRIAVAKLEAILAERSAGRYVVVGGSTYWARLQRAIAALPRGLDEERAAILGEWYRLGNGGGSGVAFVAALDHRRLTPQNLAADLAQATTWASTGRKAPRGQNGRGAAPVGAWDDTETGRMT